MEDQRILATQYNITDNGNHFNNISKNDPLYMTYFGDFSCVCIVHFVWRIAYSFVLITG